MSVCKKKFMHVFDKNGIPIYPKDVLKVFHFVGIRRKKHYMYKQVAVRIGGYLIVNHLGSCGNYRLVIDGKQLDDYEIVQGHAGVPSGRSFGDRKRIRA